MGTVVSSVTGRSGERSGAGGMFTNDDLTNEKSPSYQSLVNIPPAQLNSPLRPVTEETPVPATRTLSSLPVLPILLSDKIGRASLSRICKFY